MRAANNIIREMATIRLMVDFPKYDQKAGTEIICRIDKFRHKNKFQVYRAAFSGETFFTSGTEENILKKIEILEYFT